MASDGQKVVSATRCTQEKKGPSAPEAGSIGRDAIMQGSPHFAMVAGESSGDVLGADLIRHLRQIYPDAVFSGVGGPQMQAEGFHSLFAMDRLSVMGLVEVLGRITELLRMRRTLRRQLAVADIFVGIDAPDFNLPLAHSLREAGLATVQYVSPSVWAWRPGRVEKIRKAVDHVLCLLPFETAIYDKNRVPATFVGHPLADQLPLRPAMAQARKKLGYAQDECLVGILPGSRAGEIGQLAPLFIKTMVLLLKARPDMRFVLPCVNEQRFEQIQALLRGSGHELPIQLVLGGARDAMAASDALVVASGTATLEALLHKKPMVVSYRMHPLTYALARRLVKVPHVALPNLLAGQEIVPELLQEAATPEALAGRVLTALEAASGDSGTDLVRTYTRIHENLRRKAGARAAEVIGTMLNKRGVKPC